MRRECIFIDGSEVLKLPVTPSKLEDPRGVKTDIVNLTEVGDVAVVSTPELKEFILDSFFNAQDYNFAKKTYEPSYYIDWFDKRARNHKIIRYIVAGLNINCLVKVVSIKGFEKDGTNDVYYQLKLIEHREGVGSVTYTDISSMGLSSGVVREDEAVISQSEIIDYSIKDGDSLWSISREQYGDATLWEKVKKYNGLSSNIIHAGNVLKLPPKEILEGY